MPGPLGGAGEAIYSSSVRAVAEMREGTFRITGQVVANDGGMVLADADNILRAGFATDVANDAETIALAGKPIEDVVAGLRNIGAHMGIDSRTGYVEVVGDLVPLANSEPHVAMRVQSARVVER